MVQQISNIKSHSLLLADAVTMSRRKSEDPHGGAQNFVHPQNIQQSASSGGAS